MLAQLINIFNLRVFVFLLFSIMIFQKPSALADMIATWPIQVASDDESELLPFSSLSSFSQAKPTMANFIYILATGVERGIDSIDRWTITANIEAGHIWNDHETLTHVKRFVNDPSTQDSDQNPFTPEYDRHATSVASILGGHEPQGKNFGVAYNTELHSGALATNWTGKAYSGNFTTTPEAISMVYGAFFGFADVINSSWGGPDPTGTSFPALITDGFANENPHSTFITSAGNLGPNSNTVGGPGSGYNNITVGALQNDISNIYDAVASFSSRGPQDYSDPVNGLIRGVRAEIDLVAPGAKLIAAHYGGQTGGNHPALPKNIVSGGPGTYLKNVSGTSFSSPIVSGAAALIIHAAKSDPELANNLHARDARVVKSVLLNSADKIPGWNNGQKNHNGKIITTQALDWASGAGALNSNHAHDRYIAAGTLDVPGFEGGTVKRSGWDYGQVGIEQTNIYHINEILAADSLFIATLSWFRDRAFTPGLLTSQELGHADLDLIVRDTITKKVIAESISTYNVVEHLYFTLPASSLYQIEVNYNGNLFGSLKKEEYGLAWFSSPRGEAAAKKPVRKDESYPFFGAPHLAHGKSTVLPCGRLLVTK
ncbi:hypothetical protein CCP3SC5AM1_30038 [Gammaproteobacteria bacterium]